jgi:hypothetical protein
MYFTILSHIIMRSGWLNLLEASESLMKPVGVFPVTSAMTRRTLRRAMVDDQPFGLL